MKPPAQIHYTTITTDQGRSFGFGDDDLGEFDDPGDLQLIEAALDRIDVTAVRLPSGGALLRHLADSPPPMLWNLNSGLLGFSRTAQVAAACEMLAVPLVGSSAWTAFLVQDKSLTIGHCRDRIRHLPTPAGVLLRTAEEIERFDPRMLGDGDRVVKPNHDESSRGLWLSGADQEVDDMRSALADSLEAWGPVRVEERVGTVDISANASSARDGRLIPVEPVVVEHGLALYSGAAKSTMSHSRRTLSSEAPETAVRVRGLVAQLCEELRFRHYARFDFRWDPTSDRIWFLEANLCPSFEPNDDFAFGAEAYGMTYDDMLSNILGAAERDRINGDEFSRLPGPLRSHSVEELARRVRTM